MNEDPIKKSGWLNYPYFLAGVVLFFVIDGYGRFVNRISIVDMLLYSALWLTIAYGILYITNLKVKSLQKAGVFSGFLVSCYLFFGDIKAGLSVIPLLDKFSIVCLILFCFTLFLWWYLTKSRNDFTKLATYLNILFATLIIFDLGRIMFASPVPVQPPKKYEHGLSAASSKQRPDIYLVILDEYAGNTVLKKYFGFDNSAFLKSLQDRSFFVSGNSFSNYSSTPLSIASMFEMNYVPWAYRGKKITVEDYSEAEKTMANSSVLYFLQKQGYQFYNYSIFNIGDKDSQFDPELLPTNLKLITSKTLGNQFKKNILATVEADFGTRYEWMANYVQGKYRKGNKKLIDLTLNIAKSKSDYPKFVYTHIFMPHWPYLSDSSGQKTNYNAFRTLSAEVDKKYYLDYLKYTNNFILGVIDEIKNSTNNEAVIIVMSDHGYRKLDDDIIGSANSNLNATYLPNKNYREFYDSIGNVNQFRIVFNNIFGLNLPLKADSIVF